MENILSDVALLLVPGRSVEKNFDKYIFTFLNASRRSSPTRIQLVFFNDARLLELQRDHDGRKKEQYRFKRDALSSSGIDVHTVEYGK